MRRTFRLLAIVALAAGAIALSRHTPVSAWADHAMTRLQGGYTVSDRIEHYGDAARMRITPAFGAAGLPYPPAELAFVAIKDERRLEVFARAQNTDAWRHVRDYPVLAASGGAGPKLREGDRQVPEGVYRIELLNPNSRYHLSLRLDYPNAFDRRMAAIDGRTQLGGDIMIHGDSVSIGCLAMGDEAAEDLFVLVADAGTGSVRVIVVPSDLRVADAVIAVGAPAWTGELYASVRREMAGFSRRASGLPPLPQ